MDDPPIAGHVGFDAQRKRSVHPVHGCGRMLIDEVLEQLLWIETERIVIIWLHHNRDQQSDKKKQCQRQPIPRPYAIQERPASKERTRERSCKNQIAGARVEAFNHALLVLEATHCLRIDKCQAGVVAIRRSRRGVAVIG
ncbi:hypothetical protein NKJ46_21505 [Mesorhizobium sp. M0166]|uniref:hypothetical protein n=1 Tax=Mesorhizobium sp. M0166 TaxID=2956902 RepID=UPI00333B8D7F